MPVLTRENVISDYWLTHAVQHIKTEYGDRVSIVQKQKDLIKFGRSEQVQVATPTTLMTLPTGTFNETYVSDNLITTISSSSSSDTEVVSVEGHTISGSNLTFVVQTATLNGQNEVTLTTPLARCTRIRNTGSTDLVGAIYAYQDDTVTAGVPQTGSKVHCMIRAGQNRTEKASTSVSSQDYWIVTGVWGDMLSKNDWNAEIAFETRAIGGVFEKNFDYVVSKGASTWRHGVPYVVVPKNTDVRLRALASNANASVSGGIFGILAIVQS